VAQEVCSPFFLIYFVLGYVAAIKAAQRGLKTICVEKRGTLGGTCLNVGCIPSKALLNSTHKYVEAKHEFKAIGIDCGEVKMDFTQLMKSKDKAVTGLTSGIEFLFKKNGVDYAKGWGKFSGENTVAVDNIDGSKSEFKAKNVIIATGSEPTTLPAGLLDIDEQFVVTSTGALDLKSIPKSMIVVGGGVIGLEMGSVYNRLGTEVTVIQHTDRICPFLDKEVSASFLKILKKQGMKFKMNTRLEGGVNNKEKGVTVTLSNDKGVKEDMNASVVLLSIGRRPFTGGLELEKAGLSANKYGKIEINKQWQTAKPHIYAIGDVVDGPMLAHKAEEEGIAAVEHILGEGGHVNYDAIPGVIYSYPEVANVGLSEEQLKEQGTEYNKGVFPFVANSRARCNNESDGMVKILTDKKTDKILGAWIIGANAGEMIAEAVLAFEYGASAEDVSRTCHAHPTLSEAFKEACMAAHGKAIHC
jgi:dihydrolipoamide dehydrogenase